MKLATKALMMCCILSLFTTYFQVAALAQTAEQLTKIVNSRVCPKDLATYNDVSMKKCEVYEKAEQWIKLTNCQNEVVHLNEAIAAYNEFVRECSRSLRRGGGAGSAVGRGSAGYAGREGGGGGSGSAQWSKSGSGSQAGRASAEQRGGPEHNGSPSDRRQVEIKVAKAKACANEWDRCLDNNFCGFDRHWHIPNGPNFLNDYARLQRCRANCRPQASACYVRMGAGPLD